MAFFFRGFVFLILDAVFFVEGSDSEAALRGAGLADTFVLVLGGADFFLGASVDSVFVFMSFVGIASTLFASALVAACCLFSLRRNEERRGGFAGRLVDAASLEWTDAVLLARGLRFFEDDVGGGDGVIVMMRLMQRRQRMRACGSFEAVEDLKYLLGDLLARTQTDV